MTAALGLVPCNRVISSSGNVLAIWPLSFFWRKSVRLGVPLSDRSVITSAVLSRKCESLADTAGRLTSQLLVKGS